jgi:uncharacterized protein YndB with AHSA1/START domain
MGPISAEIDIDVPRARAFDAIADLAVRPSFTDRIQTGYRLERIESTGVGAGARFRMGPRRRAIWSDTVIEEVDPPHQLVERGRGGRTNRIPNTTVWELTEGPGSLTRVRVSHWTEPSHPVDRALDALAATERWHERAWREALRRLRDLLESDGPALRRVAPAGANRHPTGIP